jgi:hypothetical protein
MAKPLRLAQKIYVGTTKLTAADLMSNEDYECERAQLLRLATQHRRQRRLRLNPSLSLVFETRFTAWLQVQEELRWLSRPSADDINDVLTRCNLLVPYSGTLSATLFVDGEDKPASHFWIECIAANAFSVALRLCGQLLRGRSREPTAGVLAAVHTFIFQPTARCGPATEIIWGDTAVRCASPLSAMTRHVLIQDLSPASNRNCLVAPTSVEPTSLQRDTVRPTTPNTGIGTTGPTLPRFKPLRSVKTHKPEQGEGHR